jgi:dienelactone hydrolase
LPYELYAVQFELYNVQLEAVMGHEIVLFHSALGRRPAVLDWADRLRGLGHTVHTPDLFDGEVFDALEDGIRKRDSVGIPGLVQRAHAAVAGLPERLVYAGFSLGAAPAELLAGTRPGARAAILMHAALPPAAAGIAAWPRGVRVQVHYAEKDPWVEDGEVRALEAAVRASDTPIDVHVYRGDGHLFADPGAPEYDADHARLMFDRVAAFLAALP